MPTENKPADPGFDLNTPDGGRGYIADLFKTVLKRHDYRQYINERLAGDFACTLAQHFEDIKAREEALQLRLNAADDQIDILCGGLRLMMSFGSGTNIAGVKTVAKQTLNRADGLANTPTR